jgi:small-conductance mechanosensitive channel
VAAPLDDFSDLVRALASPDVLVQALVVAACVTAAWLVTRVFFSRDPNAPRRLWSSHKPLNSLMFPVLALAFVLAARWALANTLPLPLMRLVIPILASLVVVRLTARALRAAFPDSTLFRAVERTFSWVVWGAMVLWVTGLLPLMLREADEVKWTLGGAQVSLRSVIEATLSAGAVLIGSLWISSLIEARLLVNATGSNLSLRMIAANGTRALLLVVGTLMALTAAGIPLGALGVLGGAIGVGIGFGLQKLAANYVSGFVILAERSLRIGDMVKVDGFEGRITNIATRYTVVTALDGRESLVPNEMLITQRVENHSLADRRVAVSSQVQVAYGTDLDRLIPELTRAVLGTPRVLADPAPSIQLREFAADGLTLQLGFWIGDPENGQGNVRSDVNLRVLAKLNELGVEIPFPQRVVTVTRTKAAGARGES